jgi:hypothetical protein
LEGVELCPFLDAVSVELCNHGENVEGAMNGLAQVVRVEERSQPCLEQGASVVDGSPA